MTHVPSIALTGLKHVGKSTVGSSLATALGFEFVDLDDLLVRRAIHERLVDPTPERTQFSEPAIRVIFRTLGADRFGEWEADALGNMPEAYRNTSIVLATGGGVCDHPASMEIITSRYHVLYLRNDPVVLYERASSRGVPAFLDPDRPKEHFREIARRRDALYRHYADHVVDVSGLSQQDVVAQIIEHYAT